MVKTRHVLPIFHSIFDASSLVSPTMQSDPRYFQTNAQVARHHAEGSVSAVLGRVSALPIVCKVQSKNVHCLTTLTWTVLSFDLSPFLHWWASRVQVWRDFEKLDFQFWPVK
jgi:hypothetical protein